MRLFWAEHCCVAKRCESRVGKRFTWESITCFSEEKDDKNDNDPVIPYVLEFVTEYVCRIFVMLVSHFCLKQAHLSVGWPGAVYHVYVNKYIF